MWAMNVSFMAASFSRFLRASLWFRQSSGCQPLAAAISSHGCSGASAACEVQHGSTIAVRPHCQQTVALSPQDKALHQGLISWLMEHSCVKLLRMDLVHVVCMAAEGPRREQQTKRPVRHKQCLTGGGADAEEVPALVSVTLAASCSMSVLAPEMGTPLLQAEHRRPRR